MEPTIEQLSKQHATIITEVNTLESRIAQLRTDATRIEGVVMYLNQQAEAATSPEVTEVEDSEEDLLTLED
jgi:prefoldin subunit 5|tara:strand:- start:284 stop:496 length:213 start_codon:yes stop_codon:yes gene_type:complete